MFRYLDTFLKVILFLLPLSVLVALVVTQRYADSLESTRDELRERAIGRHVELLGNVARQMAEELQRTPGGFVEHDSVRRSRFEAMLRIAQLSDIQYLYAIYRDGRGGYRFWLDAETDPAQRSEYAQNFTPASDIWERVYATNESARTVHRNLEGLWITIAVPILVHGRIAAVIGADVSYETETGIARDMHSFYALSSKITLLLVSLLLLIFILVLFYGQRRARSLKDPLTGAFNRVFFHEVVVKRFEKEGYRVLIIDIDHFKKINDTYGHDAGDSVLKQLSARIRKQIRREDYFVRFGGEEFLLFMKERRREETVRFARRLLELVAATPFEAGNDQLTVTVSIGLNLLPPEKGSIDEAIKGADEALYRAKALGRNRVEITDDDASQG